MVRKEPDEFRRQLQDIVERLDHLSVQLRAIHKSNKELLAAINKNTAAANRILGSSER